MKFKKEAYNPEGTDRVYFYCPGCLAQHRLNAEEYAKTMGPVTERDLLVMSLHCMNVSTVHRFNGDFDSPTLEPSLLAKTGHGIVCHSYIRAGRMEFLSDCTNGFAGQTIELPEITDDPYGELCRKSSTTPATCGN